MTKWSFFLPLLLLLRSCFFQLSAKDIFYGVPITRTFENNEYIGGIQNRKIVQDTRGFIYVANDYGLLEYDGTNWQVYPVKNNTKVRSVAIDSDGKIYVGAQGEFGYFFPDERGVLTYNSLSSKLPEEHYGFDGVWGTFVINETIYFCSFPKIFAYKDDKFDVIYPETLFELPFVVNDQLLVRERGIGLQIINEDKSKVLVDDGYFAQRNIASIISYQKEQLLIVSNSDGIFTYDGFELLPWPPFEQNQDFKNNFITSFIQMVDGRFAMGTQNNGIYIIDNSGNTQYQFNTGLGKKNRIVLHLFEDQQNNLWAGLNNAISLVELNSPFTIFNEDINISGTGYHAAMKDGELYLATSNGVYEIQHIPSNQINNIYEINLIEETKGESYHIGNYQDQLLFGHHKGTYHWNEKGIDMVSEVPGNWLFLPLTNDKKKLLLGHYSGLSTLIWKNGKWEFNNRLSGFTESSRYLVSSDDSTFWVSHDYKGVYRIELNKELTNIKEFEYYNGRNGLPSSEANYVFKIGNEILFTTIDGVYTYDAKSQAFKPNKKWNSIFGKGNCISEMEEDLLGNIYFINHSKVGYLKKNNAGSFEIEMDKFQRINDLINDDIINITVLDYDNIIIGAKDGFVHYNPNYQPNYERKFAAHVRNAFISTEKNDSIIFGGNFTQNGQVELSTPASKQSTKLHHPYNSIRIQFSSTFYEGQPFTTYSFYLYGFENEWLEWTDKTEKEYTNLSPGKYTFMLKAKNVYGKESSYSYFNIEVLPPWYKTYIAYTIYLLVFVMLITGLILSLQQRYQSEKEKLEQGKTMAIQEKESEIASLEEKRKEQITQLQNEKLHSEINHKNRELATSTMHLMNKNSFMTHMKSKLNSVTKNADDARLKKDVDKLIKEIDQNITSDDDWKQFEFYFNEVHGDFMNRIRENYPNLTPQELKLTSYLRLNLSSKDIAQMLNISLRGVEISRYRVRKKLNLDTKENLTDFIINY